MTSKVWEVMNDLEMVTTKICSAREIIDVAVDAIQENQNEKAETLMNAAYEFLGYYLDEFDEKFKSAWKETVVARNEEERSKYYYDYDRNDLDRPNPFVKTPATSCDKDDPSPECQGAWNDFWEGGTTVSSVPKDKVVKWQLPVHQKIEDGIDDYYVQFPDDLLEAANLKEGDQVEWVDRGDGSYLLRKVTKPLGMDEC